METFAIYLLRSVIWLSGFTLVYFLFLRNERFFMLKRIYLVSGILISFLFPLFTIHYQITVPAPEISPADILQTGNSVIPGTLPSGTESSVDYRLILLSLYLSGVLFLFFRLIIQIGSLFKTINRTTINNRRKSKTYQSFRVLLLIFVY